LHNSLLNLDFPFALSNLSNHSSDLLALYSLPSSLPATTRAAVSTPDPTTELLIFFEGKLGIVQSNHRVLRISTNHSNKTED
jgi:hypothetical protein